MRWFSSTLSRFLVYVAVALVVSAVVGSIFGVKLTTTYEASVPSSSVGAAVAVVMPTSSGGVAYVNVTGASEVLYLTLGTNPIELLPQVHGLGLRIVTLEGTTDLRAGLMIEVAGIQGNPIFVEEAFESVVKPASQANGVYTIRSPVGPSEYLIVVAVPSNTSQAVSFSFHYHVTGYSRLTNLGAVVASTVLVVAAALYDLRSRSHL
ncbi:MAG: hypothetical protein ACP5HK_02900 [Acidilobus sp.]